MKRETIAEKLTDILVKNGVIKQNEQAPLHKAFKESVLENFDDFLIEQGIVFKDDLLKALSVYYQVPAFDVIGYFFDHDLLHQFPRDFLLRNRVIPLEIDEGMLVVVASIPNDPELLPAFGNYVSYDIQFRVGIGRDIEDAIKEFYDRAPTEVNQDQDIHAELREEKEVHDMEDEDILFSINEEE